MMTAVGVVRDEHVARPEGLRETVADPAKELPSRFAETEPLRLEHEALGAEHKVRVKTARFKRGPRLGQVNFLCEVHRIDDHSKIAHVKNSLIVNATCLHLLQVKFNANDLHLSNLPVNMRLCY